MVEKITKEEIETVWEEPLAGNVQSIYGKINELCDIINTIQKEREAERFEIQEWIGILEAVRKSVNVHEKQIDELQMKVEPHKCESAENTYTKTCRMDKEFAEEELIRTRKALETLQEFITKLYLNGNITDEQLERYKKILITALEQKE